MIDISEVNVGDRVKLTRENGDEATFTVTDTTYAGNGVIRSITNPFGADDWDTLEIVERAFKPVPGLYSHIKDGHRVAVTEDGEIYFTHRQGAWVEVNPKQSQIYQLFEGLRREITF